MPSKGHHGALTARVRSKAMHPMKSDFLFLITVLWLWSVLMRNWRDPGALRRTIVDFDFRARTIFRHITFYIIALVEWLRCRMLGERKSINTIGHMR